MSDHCVEIPRPVRIVERGTPEWAAMWAGLNERLDVAFRVALDGGPCAACYLGECWQYMGTWGGMHEFRHRTAKPFGARSYVRFREAEVRS